ncbi:MAG: hypothetical protein OXC13_09215 [Caldilineaceae bacterium]|nr:hypothetical protein [Caldilineaceae bacterium]
MYYKPFQCLLRAVFVLDANANPADTRPVTHFATDPDLAPERMCHIHTDRFQIETSATPSSTWN